MGIIEEFDRTARRIAEFTGIQRGFQRAGDRYNPLTTQALAYPSRVRVLYKRWVPLAREELGFDNLLGGQSARTNSIPPADRLSARPPPR